MIRLYYSDVLSPRKACAVANYLKAPVEFIYLDLPKGEQQAPAYLAINPNGKVPTLVDGDRILWEADAVMCYLSERMGADLWPQDSSRQLDIVRWFSWDARHFGRASGALYFEHIIKPRFGIGVPDPARIAQAVGEFSQICRRAERPPQEPQMAGRRRPHSCRFFRGGDPPLRQAGIDTPGRIS
jgi:glutathione S-transferase